MLLWLLISPSSERVVTADSAMSTIAVVTEESEDAVEADDYTGIEISSGSITRTDPAVEPIAEPPVTSGTPVVYITIILDDIGNNELLGSRAVNLPGEVTYAVLPHTPFGEELALQAHALGKEVMLHAPMSNVGQRPLGEGGLTPALDEEEFVATLTSSIASIPFIQGVNNHMGSELTSAKLQMEWLMRELKKHDLYFVDSLTTAQSVAGATATEYEVPNLTRQVFLDNKTTFANIDYEFQRLLGIARTRGSAVGIGHPYVETLDYLEMVLPLLEAQGIKLIPVSEMLELKKSDALTSTNAS